MTSYAGPDREPSALEIELVAYLDDELDEEARRRLERRLADEPTVRESLRKLTRVWDALETLPRAEVGDSFATTTVEAVVLKEQESQSMPTVGRSGGEWWLKRLIALAGCALLGFVAIALFWPDPNDRLAEDLPILENLAAYRAVGSMEFVKLLAEKDAFPAAKTADGANPDYGDTFVKSAALTRVAAMSSDERAAIAANQRLLDVNIDPAERERLRALRDELAKAPNSAELQRVIARYSDWLGSLRDSQRTELDSITDPQKRFDRMRQMMAADLPERDREVVWEWINDYVRKNAEVLISESEDQPENEAKQEEPGPEGPTLPRVKNARDWVNYRRALMLVLRGTDEGHEHEFPFSAADFQELESRLSAEPSARLRECEGTDPSKRGGPVVLELKKIVLAEWLRTMRREHLDGPFKSFRSRQSNSTDYAQLLGENGLSDDEKIAIFLLPPDEAQRELARQWYIRFGPKAFGDPGFGPPPGPPPDRGRGGRRGGRDGDDRDRDRDDWERRPNSSDKQNDR